MGGLSIWHLLIFAAVALLLFGGRGKVSEMMGDFGKGIKSFKQALNEDETKKDASMADSATLNAPAPNPAPDTSKTTINQG
jgi:sec-independent protein translocase protein TatA